ncbi:MAG: response regulator [Lachnospiraceae bacterium]|nr:response regulator [Lachnospiraceae bacterium]
MAQTLQTALVIDDDHLEREYLTELLLRSGFVVRAAASVPNAAAIARNMHFDCYFIDDRMPGFDGASTLKELSQTVMADIEKKPVTFLLGDARDASAQRFKEDGFSWFLEKPVDFRRLRAVLGDELEPEKPEEKEEKENDGQKQMELLNAVPGLNTDTGIANCGSMENYISALQIFYNTLPIKAEEIERFYKGSDWDNYTIKVHALKSSARIIGARQLSEKAAMLEDAGNRKDIEVIRDNTLSLLTEYRSFSTNLASLFGKGDDEDSRPMADASTVQDARSSIAEFAEQMDYDLVEMVLKSLEEYRLPAEEAARFERIRTALLSLDWDAIRREVK